jgi:hypothetical protein
LDRRHAVSNNRLDQQLPAPGEGDGFVEVDSMINRRRLAGQSRAPGRSAVTRKGIVETANQLFDDE